MKKVFTKHRCRSLLRRMLSMRFGLVLGIIRLLAWSLKRLNLPGQSYFGTLAELLHFCLVQLRRPTFYITRYIEFPLALSAMAPSIKEKILDIGCGSSPLPLFLTFKDRDVTAIDFSMQELRSLKRKGNYQTDDKRDVKCLCADMTCLPVKTASIDKVFCISVMEHLPGGRDVLAMKEILRVLKPGGMAFISFELDGEGSEEWTFHDEAVGKEYKEEFKGGGRSEEGKYLQFCHRYSMTQIKQIFMENEGAELIEKFIFVDFIFLRNFFDQYKNRIYSWLLPLVAIPILFSKRKKDLIPRILHGSFGYIVIKKWKLSKLSLFDCQY